MPSMKAQTKKMVRVAGGVKTSIITRTEAGGVITKNAPNSTIFKASADVKTAQANLIVANTKLVEKAAKIAALEMELDAERGALSNTIVEWDGNYDVYVSTARVFCLSDEDAKGLGLTSAAPMSHVLSMPLAVFVRFDVKGQLIRVRVKQAPGTRGVRIEVSPDPVTPTSFKELDGDGATANLTGYAPGTYWFRAATVRARERSDFTLPVAVIVP